MLEAVGIGDAAERVYRALVEAPKRNAKELAVTTGLTARAVAAALDELEAAGLLSRDGDAAGDVVVAPPDLALESLALRTLEQVERVRLEAHRMRSQWNRGGADSLELVEVIHGDAMLARRCKQLRESATHEYRTITAPPLAPHASATDWELGVAPGVVSRAIFPPAVLDIPGRREGVERFAEQGAAVRLLDSVPLKLLMADTTVAVIPLNAGALMSAGAVVLRSGPLLAALAMLFDLLWERAAPFAPTGIGDADGLDATDRRILALLARGLKDEAMGRQLAMSRRSVQRRVERILDRLGAETRFQAGLLAGRRGWL